MNTRLHFISAGAGSGKTYRLTQILHKKLAAGEIRASGVIATTFTRKAATELRERVRSYLLEQGEIKIANAMGQARINTVNGVCGDLLNRFAFEIGISTEQQVLEEAQEKILLAQATDSVMSSQEMAKMLAIARRMSIDDWRKDLSELIKQARSNDISIAQLADFAVQNADDLLRYFPKATQEDLDAQLIQAIAYRLPELEQAAIKGKKKNTHTYLTLAKAMHAGLIAKETVWREWVRLAATTPEKGMIHIAEHISTVANRYAEHPDLQRDIRDYLQMQFTLCARVLQVYQDRKRELGILDFTDQEHLLLMALDNDTVASTLREELDLLMVDEFQDTSPIQLALFLKLAQFAKKTYWVGDIKQAIYGFRGSDTTLMQAILDALPTLHGDKTVLDKSWRAREPLVKLVNAVFTPAFANTLRPEEIQLAAERKESLTGAAFANWKLDGSNIDKRNSALVTGVKQLLASGYVVFDKSTQKNRAIHYRDIAILSRSNDNASKIAAILRTQGVPAAILQAGLLNTPEAVLAIACLRRLNDPADTVASAEICSLANCEEPESWVTDRLQLMANAPQDRPHDYGHDWRENGKHAHPLLATLAKLRIDLPFFSPREALQTVIAQGQLSTVVLRWCSSSAEAASRLANLETLLGMARQYEEACQNMHQSASISGLIRWLNEQVQTQQDFLALPATNAVKVMTHHAAKGLEWPVVILTGLESKVRSRLWSISTVSQTTVDVTYPLKNRFIRFWPWPFGKMEKVTIAEPIDQSDIAKHFHNAAIEEDKRLLYVSMTRARDLLIFTHGARENENNWMSTVAANWLQGKADASILDLPTGETIPYQHCLLNPSAEETEYTTEAEPLYWFNTRVNLPNTLVKKQRLPLKTTPSLITPQTCEVRESMTLGKRIHLRKNADMTQLGMAIHGCMSAALADLNTPLTIAEIDAVLQRMGVDSILQSQALLDQIVALSTWIKTRWPDAIPFTEIPIETRMLNGQILQGRIDLLLKVKGGWILLDHKSNPGNQNQWATVAQHYAGQIAAYKYAVEQASGERVLESWLFFPISAGAILLHPAKQADAC
ncbi:ATP-dependent exoDNAse (exonuclease V) beta subunit (contains helicase and exonuclease domains) [Nitrosomonas cryotolerans]|uniref:DNA 3'-5' helicase n=1 Tax=Nitrosomonas cryotolerans ATCC 49181 TaxID=1131553 RepID=A0A1N6H5S0_9PROT|nr:UvrD-helicase domain-containing protein [Nitrosomonas cryotolerans]SFP71764.1 ATP-dependent exoDNAse (exonuclease V) beta subunit (contains helicase and exonuclease domains) [Nitrosomonas cryotolerans]SIO15082.1 ATP-dependent exoDNAse (exonuclease V) beta subunit (contains helicase and exonuclease domains) [Nitrosomonas cryotolerans ATCC 49181]